MIKSGERKLKEDSIIHHSLNRYFLKIFCGPGAKLGPKATVMNKTGIVVAFTELVICWGDTSFFKMA